MVAVSVEVGNGVELAGGTVTLGRTRVAVAVLVAARAVGVGVRLGSATCDAVPDGKAVMV